MMSHWSRVGLRSYRTGVLLKRGNLDTDIYIQKEDTGRRKQRIGLMHLSAAEHQRLQRLGE